MRVTPVAWSSMLLAGAIVMLATASPVSTQTPSVRQIPGLTAKDPYPNGCVDCHIQTKDGDMRLSTLMASLTKEVPAPLLAKAKAAGDASKVRGKHLPVPNVKGNIPQTCLAGCHKRDSAIAPPFAHLMHAIHLVGGANNKFIAQYGGECTYCHKLDQKTGTWHVATGAEK